MDDVELAIDISCLHSANRIKLKFGYNFEDPLEADHHSYGLFSVYRAMHKCLLAYVHTTYTYEIAVHT